MNETTLNNVLLSLADDAWLIAEPSFISHASVIATLAASPKSSSKLMPDGDTREQPNVEDGIAFIEVSGPMSNRKSWIAEMLGLRETTYGGIRQQLSVAAERDDVRAVALMFDTPGGKSTGVAAAGSDIASFYSRTGKPCYGVASMCASAGLWLASGCQEIIAEPGATIGSVGAILSIADVSRMLANLGVKVDVIKSSKHKGVGAPGTSLTDESRAYLQGYVDSLHAAFVGTLKEYRPMMSEGAMDGRIFTAEQAIELRMCDRIERDAMAYIRRSV